MKTNYIEPIRYQNKTFNNNETNVIETKELVELNSLKKEYLNKNKFIIKVKELQYQTVINDKIN